MAGMTNTAADHAQDVDSECILNDDEIATIDGNRRDVVVTAGPGSTTPQVGDSLFFAIFSSV